MVGIPPRKLLAKCNAVCCSEIFSNIRRPTIKENLTEDRNQLLNPHDTNEGKQILVPRDVNGNFIHLTIIDKEVAEPENAHNAIIVDDAAMAIDVSSA